MAWATTDPAFAAAPGFAGYRPTAAYQYVPSGGAFSPGVGTTPGVIGGSTTTGGSGASTLGGLLSAASGLGTLNSLSNAFTGKGLLDHAGIDLKSLPNPFSNFLGGDGPLSSLFGEAAPTALPSNPGLGTFWGDSAASQAFRNANNIYPSYGASTELGTAALTDAQGAAMAEALGGQGFAAPVTTPVGPPQLVKAPLEPVYGGYELGPLPEPMSQGAIDAGKSVAEAITGAETGMPTNPYSVSGGPTPAPSLGLVGNQAAMASLFPGAVGTSALAAAPGFATLAPGVTAIPSMGGALAGALGPAAAAPAAAGGAGGLLGAAGALGPLALGAGLMFALKGMKKKDPATNRKLMQEAERYGRLAQTGDTDALRFLQGRVFGPDSASGQGFLNLMKLAASDNPDFISGETGYAPFGSNPDQYPHHVIGWSPELSNWFTTEFLPDAPQIFKVRQQLEQGQNADEPLLINPYTHDVRDNIVTSAAAGGDGPVDPMMASRMSGLTSSDVEAMGFKPPGWVAWDEGLNDPNDQRFIDFQGGAN